MDFNWVINASAFVLEPKGARSPAGKGMTTTFYV